jgi:hypothetical protein
MPHGRHAARSRCRAVAMLEVPVCQAQRPDSAADAVASAAAALRWLAAADATELTGTEQAEALRALERLQGQLIAARSAVLTAFTAGRVFEDDAAVSPVAWLRWQTRITSAAASAAAGWMRDLTAHPAIAAALAAGDMSPSWARQVCSWTDRLPDDTRSVADQILLDAAAGGARLADLSGLAEEMHRAIASPDTDPAHDGFVDRRVRLLTHFRGAGTLDGELTPECAESLRAVLDSLSAKTGPEDTRSAAQRQHDALAEACRRLIAGGLPNRAGQPTQIHLHMSLDQLLGLSGGDQAVAEWAGHGAAAPPGADCDAAITPIVSGHLDPAELSRQICDLLRDGATSHASTSYTTTSHATTSHATTSHVTAGRRDGAGDATTSHATTDRCDGAGDDQRHAPAGGAVPKTATGEMARTAARELLIGRAVRLLSGPSGLAAYLRGVLTPQPAASISLPLDLGKSTETVPAYLRRGVTTRDKHCAFPGCYQPPAACEVHHLIPRSHGGPTSLDDCCLLCAFHHKIAVHRWGWQLVLNPDGTTTATLGDRALHSHAAA